MASLLKTEWLKIKAYPAFWWMVGIMALSYVSVSYLMHNIYNNLIIDPKLPGEAVLATLGNPFAFNEVWHTMAYLSSFFVFFPAILVILLITNEYTFKTSRQNVIEGWSRHRFMHGKLFGVATISIIITVLYICICLVIGSKSTGLEDKPGEAKTYFIGYFLLQTFSQLSIAFFMGFALRKSVMALGTFIFLFAILEPFLVRMFTSTNLAIGHFLPFEISNRMILAPEFVAKMDPTAYTMAMGQTGNHFFYSFLFTALLWIFSYRLNAKRDL